MHERQLVLFACFAVVLGFGGLIVLVLTQNPLIATNSSVLPEDTLIEISAVLTKQISLSSGVSLTFTRSVSQQAFFDSDIPLSWLDKDVLIIGRKNGDFFSIDSIRLLSEVEE